MANGTTRGPVVSVLMAVHDAEGYVRRAVESIQNQSLRELELIVVDAGSQDSTARVVEAMAERDLRIELVRADACSRQEALDVALERATGRYLSVVDADGFAQPRHRRRARYGNPRTLGGSDPPAFQGAVGALGDDPPPDRPLG